MKQIGTPIETVQYGLTMTAFFSSVALGLGLKAYCDQDIYAGLSSIGCLGMASLAAYNTIALGLAGNYADSINDFVA